MSWEQGVWCGWGGGDGDGWGRGVGGQEASKDEKELGG